MLSNKINSEAEVKDFGEQKTVTVLVFPADICELCMLLSLLREELVPTVEIHLMNFTFFFRVTKENSSVCSVLDQKKGTMKGVISLNALEFLLYFLLRYYRDGAAEVDHVDLDFDFDNETIVTWTVKVDAFDAMSPGEMKKLIKS